MNLVVPDVLETARFFEKHFGYKIHRSMGEIISILHGEDDFVLVISNFPKTASFEYPVDFHIGFYQPDKAHVLEIFNKLQADGLHLPQEPKSIRDRFGFYFYAPGKILVEITCATA